jgi:Zn-dependent peptidase ImmA (M78 family)
VLLDLGLSKAEARSTMTHELGHLEAGDMGCSGMIHDRREVAADTWAARKLMPVCDLASVVRWTNSRTEAAEALDVTTHLLAVRLTDLHPAERGYLARAAAMREEAC